MKRNDQKKRNIDYDFKFQQGKPDCKTAERVKKSGFPDYETYLEGMKCGIDNYEIFKMVQEGQFKNEEEMVQSWNREISEILSRIRKILSKNYTSKMIKNPEELEELKIQIDKDENILVSSKKELSIWEEKIITLIKNTYVSAELYLGFPDLGSGDIEGQGGQYVLLKNVRDPLSDISDWRKKILQKKQDLEEQFEVNKGLFKVIQKIKPRLQTSLARIAELTKLTPDTTQKLLQQILSEYPDLGEYHEYEQVFVKHQEAFIPISPLKTESKRIAFFCQLDNERHPASESAYECQECGRRICRPCYIDCQSTGITTCPYCQGELVKIQ